jgi:uncharacterized protein YecT (DUF1311 family)
MICAALGVVALSVAAPSMAQPNQYQGRDRGIDREYRRDDPRRDGASQAELQAADNQLTRVYQRRIAEARAADREDMRGQRARDWYGREEALRNAERQWIAYRDADCRYAAQDDAGRPYYRDMLRQCLVDRTEERTAVLRHGKVDLSMR